MSGIKETIEITPPSSMLGGAETIKSKAYRCPDCNGYGGWYYGEHDPEYYMIGKFKMCKACEGSGRIRARVMIVWEADLVEGSIKKKNEL